VQWKEFQTLDNWGFNPLLPCADTASVHSTLWTSTWL